MLGIIGTLAFQNSQHQSQLMREVRKMMKHNSRAIRKLEISNLYCINLFRLMQFFFEN